LPLLNLTRKQARRSVWLRSTMNLLSRRLAAVRLPLSGRRILHRSAGFFRLEILYRLWLKSALQEKQSAVSRFADRGR
jgi:hypothetical protein